MNDLLMLEKYFPGGSLEGGIELANRLDWGLAVQMAGLDYVVSSGGEPILRTDSKDALQTFLYGLGLAYAVLPEDLFISLEAALEEL
jgi:magnesium-transporting ATPase (P-type)